MNINAHDASIKHDNFNRSVRQINKNSDPTKKHRRSNNRSRLYEDQKKIFEDMMKHKNNQSLDTKIDKHLPGHLKYTTLLSKDKKLQIDEKAKSGKNTQKSKTMKTNKYYSAPVSTKENGLVTKFRFQDKKNDTQKLKSKDSNGKIDDRKNSICSKDSFQKNKKHKNTSNISDVPASVSQHRAQDSKDDMEVSIKTSII